MDAPPFETDSAVGDIADLTESDFRVDRDVWPAGVLPREPTFPHGKRPVHEHVRIQADERPDAPAITYYGRTYTWAELDDLVGKFARALAERGYQKGDVLALYLQNCPQFVVAYHGAHRAGLVAAPLNPLVKDLALEHLLTDSGADVLLTHPDQLSTYESVADETDVSDVFVTRYAEFGDFERSPVTVHEMLRDEAPVPADRTPFADTLEQGRAASPELPPVDLTDDALYQYTGGTSGLPKGCRHTHWNVFFKAVAGVQGTLQDDGSTAPAVGVLPIFHVAGKLSSVDRPPIAGTHLVLLSRYSPEAMMQAIEEYGVGSMGFTVAMAEEILDHEDVDEYDLTSLSADRDVSAAASWGNSLDEETSRRWEAQTGAVLHSGIYGLSETHTGDTTVTEHSRIDSAFMGQPTYGVEVEIRDFDTNAPLPPGEEGEIVIRTPSNMLGYRNRPDETAAVLEADGWLHTGDRGRVTEEGFLWFHGRQKDVLKVSGHTVAPREVEQSLERSGIVEDAIVVGKPHETRGHVVEAHVLPIDDDVTKADLAAWAEDHLAEFKRPKSFVFREDFPRTKIGKVNRKRFYDDLPDGYE